MMVQVFDVVVVELIVPDAEGILIAGIVNDSKMTRAFSADWGGKELHFMSFLAFSSDEVLEMTARSFSELHGRALELVPNANLQVALGNVPLSRGELGR